MADPLLLSLDVTCLTCGAPVVRIEVVPGQVLAIPDHECKEAT